MTTQEIGLRIHLIREYRGLSQTELAALIHATQPKISEIERGVRNLSFDDMRRLAEVLHFSIDAISRTGPNGFFDITACLLPMPQDQAA